jgi:hypothetical protein
MSLLPTICKGESEKGKSITRSTVLNFLATKLTKKQHRTGKNKEKRFYIP